MVQYSNFDRVMGARDHFKNVASAKSLINREKIFCFAVIAIMFIGACGQTRQKNVQNDWKTLEQSNYVVQYPDDGFELNTSGQMGTSFILFSKQTTPNDIFRENVNLLIQDLKGLNISLDDFVNVSENQIKTLITDGKLIESKRFIKDNSEFHELIYTGKQGIFNLKWKQHFTIKSEKAYVLTLTTRIEQFDSYITVGTEIMDSFKIK
ncbi:MAG: hypothetical protein FWC39_13555 [Bacteroidetes bacterium]|nr:hypothetical protein [Bacteroidota bacterium]